MRRNESEKETSIMAEEKMETDSEITQKQGKMFTLKKWNAVAMWSWDVECDTCAICRVQVMGTLSKNYFKFYSAERKSFYFLFSISISSFCF